ncbi:hypothetical protein GCM10022224_006740 [Nonomuraea antimicrobica]|uniref:Uncharacterized protein n=1 Tax=Nonomuraea antimicrobica TaxID=561173 RepID=A0ABP7B226_9ACTN
MNAWQGRIDNRPEPVCSLQQWARASGLCGEQQAAWFGSVVESAVPRVVAVGVVRKGLRIKAQELFARGRS